MTKKQKIMLVRILIAALLLVGLNFVPAEGWLRFVPDPVSCDRL